MTEVARQIAEASDARVSAPGFFEDLSEACKTAYADAKGKLGTEGGCTAPLEHCLYGCT